MASAAMKFAVFVCLLAESHFCSGASVANNDGGLVSFEDNADIHLSAPELITKYGYPVEIHTVQTEDGYILEMHRIPYGRNSPEAPDKPVVFVQHGLLSSSADWVVMGPEKALGYLLADAGYDVWLGNYRGNTYSRKHNNTPPSDGTFWDFSWHELGMVDLPTMIDYVLEVTGQKDLYYIGHSMGTTTFYVMTSMRPEYNAKIRAMFSLAPIAYMKNAFSPLIKIASKLTGGLEVILKLFGIHEFLPHSDLLAMIGQALCKDTAISQSMCSNIIFLACGFDSQELNKTMLPVLLGHTPAGASTKTVLHYGQLANVPLFASAKFRQYDYGRVENKKRYGSRYPPDYPLVKVTAPVYLHYSDNDWLASLQDVNLLHNGLGNAKKLRISHKKFNHLDYLWAIHGKELLYSKVIGCMNCYHSECPENAFCYQPRT